MKATLDLDRLLAEGKIDQAEYDKLNSLAARSTSTLVFNICIAFGVTAVSVAAIALLPEPVMAIGVGLLIAVAGMSLIQAQIEEWQVLARICMLVGALLFGGGLIWLGEGSAGSFLVVAVSFAVAGVLARSALLVVLAVLALSSCIGARTDYFQATYVLGIEEPALIILLFSIFSLGAFQLSKHVPVAYRQLAIAASRTGVLLVNLGFWIGSLWGDSFPGSGIHLYKLVFVLLWAASLLGVGIWAWRVNRRWLVGLVAMFGGIHFYTQWFERLGASAGSVLIAGVLALAVAVGVRALYAGAQPE